MVVLDATILLLLLRPESGVPLDAAGRPVDHAPARVDFLIRELEKQGSRILIPTPVLSEVLVRAGATASQQIIDAISRRPVFRIEAFDTRAAIEVAAMTRSALDSKSKKGGSDSTWAKIKYDRQIVAIARVNQASAIYSDDRDIRSIAAQADISVIGLADLQFPPEAAQHELPLIRSSE